VINGLSAVVDPLEIEDLASRQDGREDLVFFSVGGQDKNGNRRGALPGSSGNALKAD